MVQGKLNAYTAFKSIHLGPGFSMSRSPTPSDCSSPSWMALVGKGEVTLRRLNDSSVGPDSHLPRRAEEGAVSAWWWLYVTSFVLGAALIVIGFSQGSTPLTLAGFFIGVVGFFSRKIK